jgi:AraC-like DNA-binding protein
MPLHQLDVVVRVAGATLLIVLVAGARRRGDGARRFLVPLALCLCGWLAGDSPDPALRLAGPLAWPAVLLAGWAAVWLWWYGLAVFDSRFRPRGPVLALGVAWIVLAAADRRLFGEALAAAGLSRVLVALGLVMTAHLTWRLLRDRDGDLLEGRRRVRRLTVAALAGQLFLDLGADLLMGFDWRPQAFSILQHTVLLAFTAWLALQVARREAPEAVEVTTEASPPIPVPPEDPALARLRRLVDVDRVWLDPALDLAAVARAVGASEKTVRALIHRHLGHEHFRTFLNGYRVAEAKRLLSDPARRDDKLIAIAIDSGFASLPTFNRVFKELAGATPSAFRARSAPRTPARPRDGAHAHALIPPPAPMSAS